MPILIKTRPRTAIQSNEMCGADEGTPKLKCTISTDPAPQRVVKHDQLARGPVSSLTLSWLHVMHPSCLYWKSFTPLSLQQQQQHKERAGVHLLHRDQILQLCTGSELLTFEAQPQPGVLERAKRIGVPFIGQTIPGCRHNIYLASEVCIANTLRHAKHGVGVPQRSFPSSLIWFLANNHVCIRSHNTIYKWRHQKDEPNAEVRSERIRHSTVHKSLSKQVGVPQGLLKEYLNMIKLRSSQH